VLTYVKSNPMCVGVVVQAFILFKHLLSVGHILIKLQSFCVKKMTDVT